jgi:hypothetical protein
MPRQKSERVKAIEKLFSITDDGKYECLVCKIKVKDVEGDGAPGRSGHLKTHKEQWEKIPAPQARAATRNEQPKQEEPEERRARKKNRLEGDFVSVPVVNAVDFFARNLLPFSVANDDFFE